MAAVVGSVLVGVVAVAALIGQSEPLGSSAAASTPSAHPTPSQHPTATPRPAVTGLEWQAIDFPVRDARPFAIADAAGRLIVAAELAGRPAVWFSDDEGATWERSEINFPSLPRDDFAIDAIAAAGDRVVGVGLGEYGTFGEYGTHAWYSTDRGATWGYSADLQDARVGDVVADGAGFATIGTARPESDDPFLARWTSTDGIRWVRTRIAGLPDLQVTGFGARDDAFIAAGGVDPTFYVEPHAWLLKDGEWKEVSVGTDAGAYLSVTVWPGGYVITGATTVSGAESDEHFAAAWQSADGVTWQSIDLHAEPASVARSAAIGPSGTLIVGHIEIPEFGMVLGQYVWFLPPASIEVLEVDLDFNIGGLIARGDGFMGVGSCRSAEEEACPLVVLGSPS